MRNEDPAVFGCGCLGLVLVGGLIASVMAYRHQEEHVFVMSGKDRVCTGGKNQTCTYEVYGADGEVFDNSDSLLAGKWDSASFQARFQNGRTYRVTTTGWRVPFLSMKPNIIAMEEVRPCSRGHGKACGDHR